MGKGAVVLVLVTLYGWTMSHSTKSRVNLARIDQQALYQERVLAREQAHTGFDLVVNNSENDFQNYRSDLTTNAYRDGTFSISALGVSGDKVLVSATGSVGRANYTIVGELESETITPLSALNIAGPVNASLGNGNSFLITGFDTNPGGSSGSGDAAPTFGISTNMVASTEAMQNGLDGDQVTGKVEIGPDGDNSFDSSFDTGILAQLDDGINAFCLANSDRCEFYSGDQRFTGNDRFGTTEEPVIVVVDGDCEFKGNVKGYGLLRVHGEFATVTGTPRWEGVVYASTNGGLHELRGNPKIYGALILETEDPNAPMDFAIRGNVAIAYSSEALENVPVIPDLIDASMVSEVQLKNIRQASEDATAYASLHGIQQ